MEAVARRKMFVLNDGETQPLEERALLLEIARALADDPSRLKVTCVEDELGNRTFTVWCAHGDIRNIEGPGNRGLSAITTLFSMIGRREDRHVRVQVRRLNTE